MSSLTPVATAISADITSGIPTVDTMCKENVPYLTLIVPLGGDISGFLDDKV